MREIDNLSANYALDSEGTARAMRSINDIETRMEVQRSGKSMGALPSMRPRLGPSSSGAGSGASAGAAGTGGSTGAGAVPQGHRNSSNGMEHVAAVTSRFGFLLGKK